VAPSTHDNRQPVLVVIDVFAAVTPAPLQVSVSPGAVRLDLTNRDGPTMRPYAPPPVPSPRRCNISVIRRYLRPALESQGTVLDDSTSAGLPDPSSYLILLFQHRWLSRRNR
jgi:hypothetical protein